mmetsp:Transcript_28064/g.86947  ORF Transcript_28064/g.86947 Transcript_28064/m.86947 type:complete len:422 (-) Transcript_28064:29-1294(-)
MLMSLLSNVVSSTCGADVSSIAIPIVGTVGGSAVTAASSSSAAAPAIRLCATAPTTTSVARSRCPVASARMRHLTMRGIVAGPETRIPTSLNSSTAHSVIVASPASTSMPMGVFVTAQPVSCGLPLSMQTPDAVQCSKVHLATVGLQHCPWMNTPRPHSRNVLPMTLTGSARVECERTATPTLHSFMCVLRTIASASSSTTTPAPHETKRASSLDTFDGSVAARSPTAHPATVPRCRWARPLASTPTHATLRSVETPVKVAPSRTSTPDTVLITVQLRSSRAPEKTRMAWVCAAFTGSALSTSCEYANWIVEMTTLALSSTRSSGSAGTRRPPSKSRTTFRPSASSNPSMKRSWRIASGSVSLYVPGARYTQSPGAELSSISCSMVPGAWDAAFTSAFPVGFRRGNWWMVPWPSAGRAVAM